MATLAEIAGWTGGQGSGAMTEVVRVSAIEGAGADSLVFATDGRSLAQAVGSGAGCILASRGIGQGVTGDGRVVWVDDAKLAFAVAAQRLRPRRVGEIHATAVVAEDAVMGKGTRVGAGSVVGAGVRMGEDCEILANVTICAGVEMGSRVVVQSGAVLGSTGFGYVRDGRTGEYVGFPQQGGLVIEDDVEIGANTTIDRGALGETRIGRGTKIDNLVHIAHNCVIGRNVVIAAQTGISGSTVVGDGAVIGGQVGIGDHADVGAGVILGSGSGVLPAKKVRGPGQVFWGIPAQPLKEYLRMLARMRRG